ncbi:hypothetical protein OAC63_06300 [Amylibacter sp.]|jgi:hypothetical protein|nr:hypothetical protein [Amylibacter sp.]
MKPFFILCLLSFGLNASELTAQSRYTVANGTLIFDMTIEEPSYEFTGSVESYDAEAIQNYLFEMPEINTLRVTGPGGYGSAARAISAYLVQHSINTEAFGGCASACARIFLGGKSRRLATGATLGFHRPWIDKESEKNFYKANRVKKKWEEEFDYVPWIYNVAIGDVVESIEFMRSRDVDIDFILKIYSINSYDMWYPSRGELLEAGVLTE